MTGDGGGLEARIVVHRGTTFSLDVELRIEAGTTAALLGPNGAGKSTAVNAIAGILPIDRGRIAVAGRSLDDPERGLFVPPEQRRVGVVFQDYLLFEHLSVIDNVAFGPASSRRRRRRRESRQLVWRWIEALDLADLAHRRPRELSGGQAQRVALARALASEPDVLLLDEPLAALDVASRSQLRRTLAEHLSHYGGPRLVITHDPTDAFLLADRVHVVENGRLTQAGTPPEMRCRPATAYVAALAGTNLLTGVNDHGSIALDDHPYVLQAADTHTNGPVLVTIHPSAVALHDDEPHGSPRNTWPTTVATVEPLGEITRVTIAKPVPLTVDITPAATAALGIVPGRAIWASVKATEIAVNPS